MIKVDFNEIKEKSKVYNRYRIQSLIEYDKPIIVRGIFKGNSIGIENRYVFADIKPFDLDNSIEFKTLADHINLEKDICKLYFDFNKVKIDDEMVLVCRPYIYYNDCEVPRGGLRLSDELSQFGFPVIQLLKTSYTMEIPYYKIIDFRKEEKLQNLIRKEYKLNNPVHQMKKKKNNRPKTNKRMTIKGMMVSQAKQREYFWKHSYDGIYNENNCFII